MNTTSVVAVALKYVSDHTLLLHFVLLPTATTRTPVGAGSEASMISDLSSQCHCSRAAIRMEYEPPRSNSDRPGELTDKDSPPSKSTALAVLKLTDSLHCAY